MKMQHTMSREAQTNAISHRSNPASASEASVSGISARVAIILALLATAGCASIPERYPALDDARMTVNAARSNPLVVNYAPGELSQAVDALRRADSMAASGARSAEVRDVAILAGQRASLAQDAARARSAEATLMLQRNANDAQLAADASRRQAESAQFQAGAAQRQADVAQRLASSTRAETYPTTAYDYRRRPDERLYEVNVTSVRAVVGSAQERCWLERERVAYGGSYGANIPGAIIGGVIGGIIGHQIGDGRGQDLATGIGVVGGAVVGANVGRSDGVASQDVRRCEYLPAATRPDYWDVTYTFQGHTHRVQMTTPPGATILVNAQGEPRV